MWRAIISRKGSYPSDAPYCNAKWGCSSRTFLQASRNLSVGNTSAAGSPPANEITSGLWVNFSNSRIAELRTPFVRCAYRDVQAADICLLRNQHTASLAEAM